MSAALMADADESHGNAVAGRDGAVATKDGGGYNGWKGRRRTQNTSCLPEEPTPADPVTGLTHIYFTFD
jgi:hypothetical protein